MALQTLDRCKRYLEDSLNDQRFNACNWTMPNEEKELETAGYPVFPASGALEPEALCGSLSKLVSQRTADRLDSHKTPCHC